MLLIPAFVILVVYGHLGWALVVFVTAGVTDALDGLIARRSGQKTSLGAWLDPMADKLLLVTTFVVLTIPGLNLANRLPLWLTICIISRDVVIVATVAIVNLAIGPRTFRPSIYGRSRRARTSSPPWPRCCSTISDTIRWSSTSGYGRRWRSRWCRRSTTSGTRARIIDAPAQGV